ncbi:MAG: ATP-dependent DNA helicase RecG [Candidatus Azambacteria bacterium GW2011_GWB2_46_37]|uniref:ATP-dependent DNA helicase RecG n=4 Tax=Candidatus Azamiibacteriota TaxID=1752741 RepID=A0A0G1QD18_9BACT|nr:MAG: ATP-dependent DNA helicase RecG [Candidatus Azambacteria bacterium GW2011_GWB1_46_27]KKU38339.1 MAG: ATP-dependent DNA helicase RecG [Candidatus Azambacteria bacterium GW2011_GWF2_46_32]KKU39705.1 MAG: ATP-dependent DNA helicase RecG [Candidatus Azambacteria bacterium GW2011_GWB2_46_37]KKU42894.1 MAG: ATP-dependent DNA helicase RecG [Candidatus Azambacteria bacterium GW2011_GWD2_46_48]
MLSLNDPVEKISRVGGPVYLKKLHQLGVKTVRDLLFYFPRRYDDFSNLILIRDLKPDENATIRGKILSVSSSYVYGKRMSITDCLAEDSSGTIRAVWFNQPFLINTFKAGQIVNFSGKLSFRKKEAYLSNPSYEIIGRDGRAEKSEINHTARFVPVYPETKGLTSRRLRYVIRPLLFLADKIADYLPEEIKKRRSLISLGEAISQIHFPASEEAADKAKKRLAFDEIFLIQLFLLKEKLKLKQEPAAAISLDVDLIKKLVDSLPFRLTDAQKKAGWRILQDMAKPRAMNRLLEGDVGSGKTVVAAMASLSAAAGGFQTAFLAPTEILARQHYEKISKMLDPFDLKIAFLSGSLPQREAEKIIQKTAAGEIQILIGTHSIIQERVKFKNLALAVVDEQHRFGVRQRAKLACPERGRRADSEAAGKIPHFLSMTATPIPRTLALALYGDLDISRLDEMPKGRQKIVTKIVSSAKRKVAYQFIRKQIKNGRQAFVICPRIEATALISNFLRQLADPISKTFQQKLLSAEVKNVKEEYKKLSEEIFPDLKIGMLHGKQRPKEKERVMKQFNAGIIDILVSTSVVEVGVDVPNATVMMIEGADRFGLAQLHQFRGRVGRGEHQSYCLLFGDTADRQTNKRLEALVKCDDGFALAEKDLAIRGPGDFYGSRQWGLPELKVASLTDLPLIQTAREEAVKLLKNDHNLRNYPLLTQKLLAFKEKIHFE